MEQALHAGLAAGLCILALTWAVVWSRRDTAARPLAMIALLPMLAGLGFLIVDTLGHHRPALIAWDLDGEQRVLASKMVQGQGIYLYLETGRPEPSAVVFPWNDQMAQKLQDAMRESAKSGQQGAIMRYEHSWDTNEPQFHPLPAPPLPIPKGRPPQPERYERSA